MHPSDHRCVRCDKTWPEADFRRNKRKKDGWDSYCKDCAKLIDQIGRARNPDRQKRYARRFRELRKLEVLKAYGGPKPRCACCGESYPDFLCLDHINGGGTKERKETKRWGYQFYAWLAKQGFPSGYQVLCFNCNCAKGFYGRCPHEDEQRPVSSSCD